MARDPYEVLGVPRDASADDIKSAYRRLAKRYHPDLNPGDPDAAQKMNEVNQAYERIKDPQAYRQPSPNPYETDYTDYTWSGNVNEEHENPFEAFFRQYQQSSYQYRRTRPVSVFRIILVVYLLLNLVSCMGRTLTARYSVNDYYQAYRDQYYEQFEHAPTAPQTWEDIYSYGQR